MGYRSDVALGVGFKNREALVAFLSAVRLGDKMPAEHLACYKVTEVSPDMILLHATFMDVKWYDSYSDVQCHNGLLVEAAAHGAATAFVRVGEELDDNEVNIDNDDDLDMWSFFHISRRLVTPDEGIDISDYMKDTTCQTSTAASTN